MESYHLWEVSTYELWVVWMPLPLLGPADVSHLLSRDLSDYAPTPAAANTLFRVAHSLCRRVTEGSSGVPKNLTNRITDLLSRAATYCSSGISWNSSCLPVMSRPSQWRWLWWSWKGWRCWWWWRRRRRWWWWCWCVVMVMVMWWWWWWWWWWW